MRVMIEQQQYEVFDSTLILSLVENNDLMDEAFQADKSKDHEADFVYE